jgi:Spy/CpxP family protein refolding chaperone
MKVIGTAGLALIAGFGLSVAAAHAAAEPSPSKASNVPTTSAAPAEDKAASGLMDYHRHHHHGGVTQFVAMGLDTLGEDDAKRPEIEKLQAELQAQMASTRAAEKDLLLTLAAGVAAGAVDKGAVDASLARLTAASESAHGASLDTLNKLHALLSPTERADLVDKVQAHWEVWRQVNHEEAPGGKQRGGRIAELTEELSLTPDQVNKISASYPKALAGRPGRLDTKKGNNYVGSFATAFAADSFDAKSLTSRVNPHLAGHGATRMALFYEIATPVLTPEQRTKLAADLREYGNDQPTASDK